ncbi:MAG: PKD domain-containing protein, partial [Vicingaceae bacterium]
AYYNAYINGGLNKVYNNVFVRDGMGRAFYTSGGFSIAEMEHKAFGTYNGATDELSYAQGLGYDANGVEIDTSVMIFASYDSLYTCNDSLVGRGTPMMNVTDDYNSYARSTQAPTIGPEEFVSPGAFTLGEDFDLCSGDTVMIGQEVFGATYSWTPGSQNTGLIAVTAPGTYGLSLTTGCGNASDDITISSGDAVASFAAANSWLTAIFSNVSQKATSYSWDFGDGNTSTDMNPQHLYAATGTYNVCLTSTGECGSDQTCQDVMVSDYVGINSLNGENAVNIYPNPASDVVNINVSGVAGSVLNIEVSNIAGQVILTRQLNDFNGSATTELDISDLNKGVFLVKIYTEDMITTKRLVVQK